MIDRMEMKRILKMKNKILILILYVFTLWYYLGIVINASLSWIFYYQGYTSSNYNYIRAILHLPLLLIYKLFGEPQELGAILPYSFTIIISTALFIGIPLLLMSKSAIALQKKIITMVFIFILAPIPFVNFWTHPETWRYRVESAQSLSNHSHLFDNTKIETEFIKNHGSGNEEYIGYKIKITNFPQTLVRRQLTMRAILHTNNGVDTSEFGSLKPLEYLISAKEESCENIFIKPDTTYGIVEKDLFILINTEYAYYEKFFEDPYKHNLEIQINERTNEMLEDITCAPLSKYDMPLFITTVPVNSN